MDTKEVVNKYDKEPRKRRGTVLRANSPEPKRRRDQDNVFVNESFQVEVVRRFSDGYKPVDVQGTLVYKRFGYNEEYTSYTKVFTNNKIKAKIQTLSLRAKEMLLHIILYAKAGEDKIKLDKESYCELYDLKATTFSNTRMELMEAHIILDVKKQKDFYWINPYYLFNGNRLKSFEPFITVAYNYTGDNYEEYLETIKAKYWETGQLPINEEEDDTKI